MESSCENLDAGTSGEASIIFRVAQVPDMSGEHRVLRAGRMKRRTRKKERKSSWAMIDLYFFDQPSVCCTRAVRDPATLCFLPTLDSSKLPIVNIQIVRYNQSMIQNDRLS